MDKYQKQWEKVESLEKKGLTASAIKETVAIYNMAFADGNQPQQVKAAMYQMTFRNMIEEDVLEKNIRYLDTLIGKSSIPAKNIFLGMQAEMMSDYLISSRYYLSNRTKLSDDTSTDIKTWSLEKMLETTTKKYKESISREAILKNTSIADWDLILEKGKRTRHLRPTLYDFLAHRALIFFNNDINSITKPAYAFSLDDEKVFTPATSFINTRFITKDSTSLHFHALLLLQDIIRFHINDAEPDALLDADLIRLSFAQQVSVLPNKEMLFEQALTDLENRFSRSPVVAQAMFLRAGIYANRGADYDPFIKKEHQYERKRAAELCEMAIKKYPGSEGAANCTQLLNDIRQPSLNLTTEQVNLPNEPFRTLVKYKNSSKIYLRIIKTSRKEIRETEYLDHEKKWNRIVKLPSMRNQELNLPDLSDFQEHTVEIKIDPLPVGTYYILASLDPAFSLTKNIIARQITHVSEISLVKNGNNECFVLNRSTGAPLPQAVVHVWKTEYNSRDRKYDEKKVSQYTTDKLGYCIIQKQIDYTNYLLQVTYKNDELFTGDHYYLNNYNSYESEEQKTTTFLFTDRSIYRPGQTIHFKGIVVEQNDKVKKNAIVRNYKTLIRLTDANGQKTGELSVTSNDYGSFNGRFTIPENLLNGQFYLMDTGNNSVQYLRVEEYKRPKFLVDVKIPAGTYRVNDSIRVTGSAMGYAGNGIDGAKVTYRVTRKTIFPIWWHGGYAMKGGRPGMPWSREEMEVANGETTTDQQGRFTVNFLAIPDRSIDKKSQPIFHYDIHADVTDINGETRSAQNQVSIAYQALKLDIQTGPTVKPDSLYKMNISSTNINGIFEKTNIRLDIYALQAPDKFYRDRYWETPDQFMMSKTEYQAAFPYDIYQEEHKQSNWPVSGKVLEKTDSTMADGTFTLPKTTWADGWYKAVVFTTDRYGEEVSAEKMFRVQSVLKAGAHEAVMAFTDNRDAQPGQTIGYKLTTGLDRIWMIQSISRPGKESSNSISEATFKKPIDIKINAEESDRGGISLQYAFIKHNRIFYGDEFFPVAWNNKKLNIRFETFRDKTLPGSHETWSVQINGEKADQIAAEALISMYDASLDQFNPHNWRSLQHIWPAHDAPANWSGNTFKSQQSDAYATSMFQPATLEPKMYDAWLNNRWKMRFAYEMGYSTRKNAMASAAAPLMDAMEKRKESDDTEADGKAEEPNNNQDQTAPKAPTGDIQVRKNFNETAFFYPDLKTDEQGNIRFSFTMPEALTQWKIMALAHNAELASGYTEKTSITQKPLMLIPNMPRFVREGDKIHLSAKISNVTDKDITGTIQLELFDEATGKSVDGWFQNIFPVQYFTAEAGQSTSAVFPLEIPQQFNSVLTWRIRASDKDALFSDGEESVIPVLSNRTLVTESMPINLRNTNKKQFEFKKLSANQSPTLVNHSLTVEYSSNPAWYAVQSLPYLMEFPFECSEQQFNRYFANTLASYVCNSNPAIKAVFDKWRSDSSSLKSNLQKNEELKSILLQETPWVLNAMDEQKQKEQIALLFDIDRLASERKKTIKQLMDMQLTNGGFSWFKNGPDNRFITQYIITGIGHLRKLNALDNKEFEQIKPMLAKAIQYLDERMLDDYRQLLKRKVKLATNQLSTINIQFLYMRSFFSEMPVKKDAGNAFAYYNNQAKKFWLSNSRNMQAMIALSLSRNGDSKTSKSIIKSLKENAIYKEEMGMYWKDLSERGYYWHQSPIENQALMIEAFAEIDKNNVTIDDLKTWLLKNKQTNHWGTTKATAEACYALLLTGSNWLSENKTVEVILGKTVLNSKELSTEAGTGYFKNTIQGEKVTSDMGHITVTVIPEIGRAEKSTGSSWGAVHWQYFEDLDKISSSATSVKLNKKIFIEKNSDRGPVLHEVKDGDELHIGDKLVTRIELRSDRDMEFVHMKDLRSAGTEPVNVISQYKWQGPLGYYETTKDAATHFFFDRLPRGTFVFEYPVFVTHAGNFSNGITSIQCMYAPEFNSHSEGIRVNVEK